MLGGDVPCSDVDTGGRARGSNLTSPFKSFRHLFSRMSPCWTSTPSTPDLHLRRGPAFLALDLPSPVRRFGRVDGKAVDAANDGRVPCCQGPQRQTEMKSDAFKSSFPAPRKFFIDLTASRIVYMDMSVSCFKS
eukprot:766498-Hanusia_phi.AAC.4